MVPTMVCFAHKYISQSNGVYNGSFLPINTSQRSDVYNGSCFPQTLPRGLFPNGFLCPPTLLGRMVCPLWPLSTIIADDSQLTTGYILLWVLVAHHPLTTHCPLLITNYLPATSYKTCHYQLPTKNFLLSTAPFSLLTTDYFLLTSSRATTEY